MVCGYTRVFVVLFGIDPAFQAYYVYTIKFTIYGRMRHWAINWSADNHRFII